MDDWIEQLKQCKQLDENSIKSLCEKVSRTEKIVSKPLH